MHNHRLARFVGVLILIASGVFFVIGLIALALMLAGDLFQGWGPGWRGWLFLPIVGASLFNAITLLVFGAVLLLLARIDRNVSLTRAQWAWAARRQALGDGHDATRATRPAGPARLEPSQPYTPPTMTETAAAAGAWAAEPPPSETWGAEAPTTEAAESQEDEWVTTPPAAAEPESGEAADEWASDEWAVRAEEPAAAVYEAPAAPEEVAQPETGGVTEGRASEGAGEGSSEGSSEGPGGDALAGTESSAPPSVVGVYDWPETPPPAAGVYERPEDAGAPAAPEPSPAEDPGSAAGPATEAQNGVKLPGSDELARIAAQIRAAGPTGRPGDTPAEAPPGDDRPSVEIDDEEPPAAS